MAPDPKLKEFKRTSIVGNPVNSVGKNANGALPPPIAVGSSPAVGQVDLKRALKLDAAALGKINEEVRAHFAKGYKSANKLYSFDESVGSASVEKRDVREQAREKASAMINIQRAAFRAEKMSLEARGKWLMEQARVAGNCGEMCAAVIHLANSRKVGFVWLCTLSTPGDHCLCIVNNGTTPTWKSLLDTQDDTSGAWAIDPWANIVCEMKDYVFKLRMKFMKWSGKGKEVYFNAYGSSPQWLLPDSASYQSSTLCATLEYDAASK